MSVTDDISGRSGALWSVKQDIFNENMINLTLNGRHLRSAPKKDIKIFIQPLF